MSRGTGKRGKAWADYEEVAQYVLQQIGDRFDLAEVQGKQKVFGRRSGTTWEIDAKGVRSGGVLFVVVECRRYRKSLTQEALAAVAYRIGDVGADGAITVSPMPLQKGARLVAAANGIAHVQLRPDSTREQWIAQIGEILHMGLTVEAKVAVSDSLQFTHYDEAGNVVEEWTDQD